MKHSLKISLKGLQFVWVGTSLIYLVFYAASIHPMILSFMGDAEQLYSNALPLIGLTREGFALFFTVINLMLPAAAWSVAVVIFWKRRNDRMALLVSATLVTYSSTLGRAAVAFTVYYPDLHLLVSILRILAGMMVLVLLSTFPDGRFTPRLSIVMIIVALLASPYAGDSRNYTQPNVTTPALAISITWFLIGLAFQVWRYRWHSTPIERQQTKWILFSMMITIFSLSALATINVLLGWLPPDAGLTRLLTRIIANTFLLFVPASFVPVAIGIAIMRNRLWDIDLIINRSIVVVVATLLLATLFLVIVLVIRSLFQDAPGGLPFFLAAVIAGALFNPTRQRVQHFLDRRFYRWRFDLIQLVAAEHDKSKTRFGSWTGRNVDGYHVESIIGSGGMAEVYRASKDNHVYALKALPEDAPPDDARRFLHEAAIMARLKHENIVEFVGAGLKPSPYIALELIDGVSLRRLMVQRGRFSPEDGLQILRGLTEGLDYAHSKGVIHRDLKPTNILLKLAKDGGTLALKLIDFGLATVASDTTITGTGAIGTIAYMAPEQIELSKAVTPKTDIYALGVILYEMLTGQPPFMGNPGQVLFAHLHQPPPDPREIIPTLSPVFATVIRQAMAKDAAERWPSAGAMIRALAQS